ncbi:MAG: hypothetical protein M1817_000790 [Caeruleum heppii]|nr:MAG: hypothetical protein M1817_000790 [Caeruleum heppii]
MLARRHRSSTSASASSINVPITAELQPLIQSLHHASTLTGKDVDAGGLADISSTLHQLRRHLIETPNADSAKDAFRHLYGFEALVNLLRVACNEKDQLSAASQGRIALHDLTTASLTVLSDALAEHAGNRRYFQRKVDGDGWLALEKALLGPSISKALNGVEHGDQPSKDYSHDEGFFGCLFGFALGDESFSGLFRSIQRDCSEIDSPREADALTVSAGGSPSAAGHNVGSIDDILSAKILAKVTKTVSPNSHLKNPEILAIIYKRWQNLPTRPSSDANPVAILSATVLFLFHQLCLSSEYNLRAIHKTCILSTILPYLFDNHLSRLCGSLLLQLAGALISLGLTSVEDGRWLYTHASESEEVAGFLLRTLRSSTPPPHIHFDLSLHGFSSVELPAVARSFPPTSSSSGYSLVAWVYVATFDNKTHTTIFGAFDASQTCFVLAYLERDTRNFILQTSVTASRPSVRFKSVAFEQNRWYHIGLVHRRPRTTASSKASLFVDGEFVEQIKCHYPSSPPNVSTSTGSSSTFPKLQQQRASIQTFVGTPQDLSSRLGTNVTSSRWSLASFHLFDEAVSDDLIAVYHRLGPIYYGNFQDCLGSFQTYEASAALNLRNESLHPGKEDGSDIVAAIRQKASGVLPESRLILGVYPTAILVDDRDDVDFTQIVKAMPKQALHNLQYYTRGGANAIMINSATPAINTALIRSQGVAVLTGEPIVTKIPYALDDTCWRSCGCAPILLKMVERARSRKSILRSVEILFQTVRNSWRNSEAMERQNGFGILSALIRSKLGIGSAAGLNDVKEPDDPKLDAAEQQELELELLSLVLDFVGYCTERPNESTIINPLAYRVLLVDLDVWRKSAAETQQRYYAQFMVFSVESKHHRFNTKRLLRMRIVRRLLEALKAETISSNVLPHFLKAFAALLRSDMSSEMLRSTALFITYALHKDSVTKRDPSDASIKIKGAGEVLKVSTSENDAAGADEAPRTSQLESGHDLSLEERGMEVLNVLGALLCDSSDTTNLQKFARTVTNKWLLYLIAEDQLRCVVWGLRILAHLLLSHGRSYTDKFVNKSSGFVILQSRLRGWWHSSSIWHYLFSILFGQNDDGASVETNAQLQTRLDTYVGTRDKKSVVVPEVLTVIVSLLGSGLRNFHGAAPTEFLSPEAGAIGSAALNDTEGEIVPLERLHHEAKNGAHHFGNSWRRNDSNEADVLKIVCNFLIRLHETSPEFRDYAASSNYVQQLVSALYPVVVNTLPLDAEMELRARNTAVLDFKDALNNHAQSLSGSQHSETIQTTTVNTPSSPKIPRARPRRRGSSFVLVTSGLSHQTASSARLDFVMSPSSDAEANVTVNDPAVQSLVAVLMAVLLDQILERKDFSGFGLFLKVPPGLQGHQATFESYLLKAILSRLSKALKERQQLMLEPRVLTNVARLMSHLAEAVFEGWFLQGAEPLLDFTGTILEYLQRPEVAGQKSVRLCSQSIVAVRSIFLRVVLLQLSEEQSTESEEPVNNTFLEKMAYWQTIILSPENTEADALRLTCYLLYTKLVDHSNSVRLAAANLWRMLLVQKPDETSAILNQAMTVDQKRLSSGFKKLMELDNETFLCWIDDHRGDLDAFFFGAMARAWAAFVKEENAKTKQTAAARLTRRKEKLKRWMAEEALNEDSLHRHEVAAQHWTVNISASEHIKHQRNVQDQQDTLGFLASAYNKLDHGLKRPGGLLEEKKSYKVRLDPTEGRNRMRMRLLPDTSGIEHDYRPKQRQRQSVSNALLKPALTAASRANGRTRQTSQSSQLKPPVPDGGNDVASVRSTGEASIGAEDEFEMIEDPRDNGDSFEDKNRRVMRSLQRGDQVLHVHNVSRIIGLESCEGLLILGKDALYLLDHFFQRSDGEIVSVWQAPEEERDPYLQFITGRKSGTARPPANNGEQDARSWRWEDLISISKRRFLFRDVAIEVFFTDGRSYLLTTLAVETRDILHGRLLEKAPHVAGTSEAMPLEDHWRLEAVKSHENLPQTFGAKFANVFNSSHSNPATRRWARGELSNFHYLMVINTMAGRTFNDLTQYPVFPWVLADYTSEELDLDNPRSFRDLSLPMGGQTPERQADFRGRYQSLAEMGDENSPPFHYGTHYSSAMIVTSYLIRMEPFVQSYLLLQGGSFDHADRLFFSIPQAWTSASRDNMTDVRELIPEFFYLPDFLENSNGYDFGVKQGDGKGIDEVVLPPWAKGDPKIFIAKHREALESPIVSQQLHQWIDLVFGFKQQGEAAIEATNVFHHLSYRGAKDLDTIEDPVERLATIGIIHNFGQTPHQVFPRRHPPQEETSKVRRLDTAVESLTRLPYALMDTEERVMSLLYSTKHERLLTSGAFRLHVPPNYEKHMEWGFVDHSVRFYLTDSRKLVGLFEHLHQGQLTCAIFADSRTLITASTDSTISVWAMLHSAKTVDLQPKATLFGHTTAITSVAVSRSFSTIVSASADGQVYVWDLNRLELIRKLGSGEVIESVRVNDVTGEMMICRGGKLTLFTLNGQVILEVAVSEDEDDCVGSCAFYEGVGNEWLERELIFTGHRGGVVNASGADEGIIG